MEQITTAAHGAGARRSRVRPPHPTFAPATRRSVLATVRRLRSDLGLSTGDILVLDSLLSFLPCRERETGADRPITPDTMLVIYASNASLCARANGMDERVLRRHLARLAERGLLERRDSATGKRFPLRSGGRVTGAYGLDLTPLLERHAELCQRARDLDITEEEARSLRSVALTVRAGLMRVTDRLPEPIRDYVMRVKTILRRTTLTLPHIRTILAELTSLARTYDLPAESTEPPALPSEPRVADCPATDDESGTAGKDVREVEPLKIDTEIPAQTRTEDFRRNWSSYETLATFFPDPPRSSGDLLRILHVTASMIRIRTCSVAAAVNAMGWPRMLSTLDHLMANSDGITNADAYLRKMVSNARPRKSGA